MGGGGTGRCFSPAQAEMAAGGWDGSHHVYSTVVQSLAKCPMVIDILQELILTFCKNFDLRLNRGFPGFSWGCVSACGAPGRVTRRSLFSTLTASSQCRPNPCKNGGTCIRHKIRSKFTCKCPEPFRGRFCEIGTSQSPGRLGLNLHGPPSPCSQADQGLPHQEPDHQPP